MLFYTRTNNLLVLDFMYTQYDPDHGPIYKHKNIGPRSRRSLSSIIVLDLRFKHDFFKFVLDESIALHCDNVLADRRLR